MLCRCWLGGRKGIRPVKNWAVGCWYVYLPGARCRLAYGPADATATHCLCFSKIQIGFTFLILAYPGCPGKGPLNVCVCVCVSVSSALTQSAGQQEGHQACKNWVVECWCGCLSGASCSLAYGPADATATHCLCFSKIQFGFTFLVPAHPGNPGPRAVKRVCVCVLSGFLKILWINIIKLEAEIRLGTGNNYSRVFPKLRVLLPFLCWMLPQQKV